jgi:replicative superfamily II helicase
MNQHSARWCSLLVILALTVAPHHLAAQEAPKPAAKPEPALVKKLVEQLKSGDFKTRDAAAKELLKLDDIPDALREVVKAGDLETRRRAEAIVSAITARLDEKAFQAMVKDLHKVELDRLVRRMVTDPKSAGDNEWRLIEILTKAVTKKASEIGGRQ